MNRFLFSSRKSSSHNVPLIFESKRLLGRRRRRTTAARQPSGMSNSNGHFTPSMSAGDHRPGLVQPLLIVAVNFDEGALVGGDSLAFPGICQAVFCLRIGRENLIDVMKGNVLASAEIDLKA
jgi:hypothetical protein